MSFGWTFGSTRTAETMRTWKFIGFRKERGWLINPSRASFSLRGYRTFRSALIPEPHETVGGSVREASRTGPPAWMGPPRFRAKNVSTCAQGLRHNRQILRAFTPTECANYFRNSRYVQSQKHHALVFVRLGALILRSARAFNINFLRESN